ncbi:MAG: regulatory protein RecX [Ginsengibacter sp.]
MSFTPEQSLSKIKHFCAYQERCHSEVKTKLYSFGLNKDEVEEIVYLLITENYLNEERFAIMYAGGKFRMRQWGKNKIRQSLKQKQISDYCIKKALNEIDEEDYRKTFFKLAEQKIESLKKEKNIFIKKRKLQDYLIQKGYETNLIMEVVNSL